MWKFKQVEVAGVSQAGVGGYQVNLSFNGLGRLGLALGDALGLLSAPLGCEITVGYALIAVINGVFLKAGSDQGR